MKNFRKIFVVVFVLMVLLLPTLSFAQQATAATAAASPCAATVTSIGDILCKTGSFLKLLIPVLITLGIVYFIWGIVTYVIGGDEEAKTKGKSRMIYGIIGFVVIFALQGIISIIITTFGLEQGGQLVTSLVQNNSNIVEANIGTCALANSPNLGDVFNYATCFINNSVIPLIASLAVATFIWGVIQYVMNTEEEAKREKGKQFMIWGIIGLTVMVGVWGLVSILGSTFGIEYAIPQLK